VLRGSVEIQPQLGVRQRRRSLALDKAARQVAIGHQQAYGVSTKKQSKWRYHTNKAYGVSRPKQEKMTAKLLV